MQGLQATILHDSDVKYEIVLTGAHPARALVGLHCLTTMLLSAFYITYIVFSIPGTLLAKAILPSHSIALGAFLWSIAAASMAGARSFGSIIVCRLFIGLGEALFGQAVTLHYSLWYKKDEISKRLALFIGAGVLAGAFGGLMA